MANFAFSSMDRHFELVSIWELNIASQLTIHNDVAVINRETFNRLGAEGEAYLAIQVSRNVRKPAIEFFLDGTNIDRYFIGNRADVLSKTRCSVIEGNPANGLKPVLIPNDEHEPDDGAAAGPAAAARQNTGAGSASQPKKAPNSFILYRQDVAPQIRAQNPEADNRRVSQLAGASWAQEPPDVKERYAEQSRRLQAEINARHAATG
ncbi:hypothetical protein F5Y16DRAFT_406883 [Xylariaceae sp. FL0255]|nr:hypothetical protein F5Y16DRAFT_406883 [Xylariaceae sp. FL0255]